MHGFATKIRFSMARSFVQIAALDVHKKSSQNINLLLIT